MKKIIYLNIAMLILLTLSKIFSVLLMPKDLVQTFFLTIYWTSEDTSIEVLDFTNIFLLIGFALNIYFLIKTNKKQSQ